MLVHWATLFTGVAQILAKYIWLFHKKDISLHCILKTVKRIWTRKDWLN